MGKRSTGLPRFVRRHRSRFRAVLTVAGRALRSTSFATVQEASTWAEQVLAVRVPDRPWTVQDAFDALLVELRVTARAATIEYYRNHWRLLTAEGAFDPLALPASITARAILIYAERRRSTGVGDSTIWGKDLQVLSRVLAIAEREGHVARNVMRDVPRPRVRQRRFDAMATETVEALLDRIRAWPSPVRHAARDADIVDLLFCTGLRLSELVRLRAGDVNDDTAELRVDGKTGERILPLRPEALAILRRFAATAGTGHLVGSVDLVERAISRWQKRLLEPRLHAHALRHSYATAMARAGVSPYDLRDFMGHASLQQTLAYYHTQSDRMRSAAAAIPRRRASAAAPSAAAGPGRSSRESPATARELAPTLGSNAD